MVISFTRLPQDAQDKFLADHRDPTFYEFYESDDYETPRLYDLVYKATYAPWRYDHEGKSMLLLTWNGKDWTEEWK